MCITFLWRNCTQGYARSSAAVRSVDRSYFSHQDTNKILTSPIHAIKILDADFAMFCVVYFFEKRRYTRRRISQISQIFRENKTNSPKFLPKNLEIFSLFSVVWLENHRICPHHKREPLIYGFLLAVVNFSSMQDCYKARLLHFICNWLIHNFRWNA